ncbi:MAG: AAA family ATPase [Gammaproteobacteria bacterium]|nr:AAA family ATPase [Rhodocyclaceae bacterium]MBU3908655.1 AAA family ATPase [Gammaproteobacteria bacterium]MBU3988979.1 AAA family ATPase [Gammaproteobacteria bacterium]MBU4004683.1 AAA family ATPase [Gammaproteobacteria bacterium]MBU4021286.1 AAA family ATPase [Gammaproteobacteria bacterium]
MLTHTPLPPDVLFTPCDPAAIDFTDTAALPDLDAAQIHPRAIEALHLGLDVKHKGYNLFVLGDPGSGRHAIIKQLLEAERKSGTAPADWCYVNNFAAATRPRLLRLPCGRGTRLHDAMERFVDELGTTIGAVFDSDEYRQHIESLQEEEKNREEAAMRQLGQASGEKGVALLHTPHGFIFSPLKDGEETLSPEEFEKLPEDRQQELGRVMEEFHEKLHQLMKEFPRWRRETQNKLKAAGRDALKLAVDHMIDELRPDYADLPEVTAYLDAVMQDIVESSEALRESTKSDEDAETTFYTGTISIQRYRVNLLVENAATGERPVVYEDHPTLQNLVGRIEHLVHMGTLVSNFTLIKAGALHRANGGFLILDAMKVLSQPYAWEGLKRTLKAGEIRIESLAELIGLSSTTQMEPQPVPLDVKVVLIGERLIYFLLAELDPDFAALFKINADMASEIERNPENTAHYARLIATLARRAGLRPLSAAAVARLIEHAARLANDAQRLTTQTQPLDNLMHEAEHFAAQANAACIEREHLEKALEAHRHRHERLRQRYQEEILRGQLLIDSAGLHIGQINGLAVVPLGESSFAHPVRITATVRMGEGEVIDIEREVELGGPIHSKGVLILSSFLSARFGWAVPLSLKASLVFEQSYGGVEGDSASLAELAALLSALSGIPIRQSLAVTGSVNQFGVVQAVGGINEKIEGFFDICAARGLSGEQGVVIPATNVCHLMLREEVVAAVRAGRFQIWAVDSIDAAMELLTGLPAGKPDDKGEIPPGSVNYQIAVQLAELAKMHQEFGNPKPPSRQSKKAKPSPPPTKKPPAPG